MELSPRMALALELCRGGTRLIDVGCDHASLCIAAVKKAGFAHAIASDLHEKPLEMAKLHIGICGLSDWVETRLACGLEGIEPEQADTVAICGMGGELIAAILADAPWTADGKHRMVLQPMTCADRLRRWLAENGYEIRQERLAKEGEKLYIVMEVAGGKDDCGSSYAYLFTEKLRQDPLFPLFLEREMARISRACEGRSLAGLDTARERELLRQLEVLRHGA